SDASMGSSHLAALTHGKYAHPLGLQVETNLYVTASDQSQSFYLGDFYDLHPGSEIDYTLSIDWGDGTTSDGQISPTDDGGFELYGDHTYATEGAFNLSITITKNDGATAS